MTDSIDDNNGFDDIDEPSFAELFESYDSKIGQELSDGDMVEGKIIAIVRQEYMLILELKVMGLWTKQNLLMKMVNFHLKLVIL